MKNYLSLIIAALISVSLFGCDGVDNNVTSDTTSATDTTDFSGDTQSSDETDAAAVESPYYDPNVDYSTVCVSDGIDNRGYFEGIVASEFVNFGTALDELPTEAQLTAVNVDEVTARAKGFIKNYPECLTEITENRAVAANDIVLLSYNGFIGESVFSGSRTYSDTAFVLGNDDLFGDDLSALIGHKKGDTVELAITLGGEDTDESLIGREAVFTIEIKSICEADYTVLAKTCGYKTLDEFYEYVENLIIANRRTDLFDSIAKTAVVSEIPEAVIQYVYNYTLNGDALNAYEAGKTLEDYIAYMYGHETMSDYLHLIEAELTEISRLYIINQAIAEAKGITAESIALEDYGISAEYTELTGENVYRQYILMWELVPMALVSNAE